jgi:hypothetical protein
VTRCPLILHSPPSYPETPPPLPFSTPDDPS